MLVVIKLVNIHFNVANNNVKWSFQTIYDNITDARQYNIINGVRSKSVSKELGNKMFRFITKHFPGYKIVTIIDCEDESSIQCVKVVDHYEIRVGGKFVESCDVADAKKCMAKWREILCGVDK